MNIVRKSKGDLGPLAEPWPENCVNERGSLDGARQNQKPRAQVRMHFQAAIRAAMQSRCGQLLENVRIAMDTDQDWLSISYPRSSYLRPDFC